MSYSESSPIHSYGLATAEDVQLWFESYGPALAKGYSPDRQYQAPPADLGAAIVRTCEEAEARSGRPINHDLVAAQILKESAAWQSAIVRAKNNPSGLGAINSAPMEGAITFETPSQGIIATVAHLMTYTLGRENPWWGYDPRAEAVPVHNLGIVRMLRDLDGRWAVPGQGYGAGIARLANELIAVGGTKETPPNMADDPHAQWLPSSNYTAGRGPVVLDRCIIHTTEGSYDGSLSWLRGAAAGSSNTQSSAHYLLDANGGRLAQMVREHDTAWTAGNYGWNLRSINIEMEGYAGKGGFTDGLYQAVGALVARIAARHKIPLDREHVIGHKDVPNQDHWDPGEHFSFDQLLAIARGETEGHAQYQSVKLQSDKRDMPTGLPLWHGFKTLYEEAERAPNQLGIRLLGVGPITAPFDMAFGDNPGQIYTVVLLERGGGFMYEGGQKEPWRNHALTTWQAVEAWNHAIKHKLIPEHLIPKHLR